MLRVEVFCWSADDFDFHGYFRKLSYNEDMLWEILAYKGIRKLIESSVPDPLAADGKPVDLSWTDAQGHETQRVVHDVELDLSALQALLPRLQHCFDRSLTETQVQVITNRVGRLESQQQVMLHFAVRHRGEATTLDIGVSNKGASKYQLLLRGTGAAMTVLQDEIQALMPTVAPVVPSESAAPPVAALITHDGLSDDGVLRLTSDRSHWRALLPLSQGHFLGHPIFVTVENTRTVADIQPQPSDHQLLMQIYADLPKILQQVMQCLSQEISDAAVLRQLHRPTILLSAERVDSQMWTFTLTHADDPTRLWCLPFRKSDKQR